MTKLEGIREKVFIDRYALKNSEGEPLESTPEQMWNRVATAIASVEPDAERIAEWAERFYALLRDFKFVPAGRILSGAGTGGGVSLYNCFVVGVGEDPLDPAVPIKPQLDPGPARDAFFKALAEMTDIMSRSGGVGMNLSSLPPTGTLIPNAGRTFPIRPTVALSIDHPDLELLLDEVGGPNLRNVDIAVIVPRDAPIDDTLYDRICDADVPFIHDLDVTISVEDSRHAILTAARVCSVDLFNGRQPTIDFSALRAKGSYIKSVNGTSSGPVAWMYLFDAIANLDDGYCLTERGVVWFAEIASVITGKTIQQGGSRRGALMVMLDDDHPDIEEFVTAKKIGPDGRPVMIEHANMSICISDAFMFAVTHDLKWDLKWQGQVVRSIKARDLWDKICTSAWATAEPGVVFMQRGNERSNTHYFENIRCVNPCGEQLLPPGGVCNLGAMNLAAYVSDYGELCKEELACDVAEAVRFLDNVIDATPYFTDLHAKMQRDGTRRTGLGTMGLADALIKMKVAYGSPESMRVIDDIYSTIRDAAYAASIDLAAEKGPFPQFVRDEFLKGWFIDELPGYIQDQIEEYGIRNGVILTQAPTGTTSLLAGVSSGIEPVFDFAMKRVDRTGEHVLYHPLYQAWREAHPNESKPAYFRAAKDLTPDEHVKVQGRIQYYTDSSISKTVNGPNHDTVEDVKRLYTMAYEAGCKGVTYYRDGSRDAILTSIKEAAVDTRKEDQNKLHKFTVDMAAAPIPELKLYEYPLANVHPPMPAWIAEGRPKHRPNELMGYTRNITAPEGTVNLTINYDADGPLEVFINVGRAGSDIAALAEAMGRLISLQLQLPSTMSQHERLRQVAAQLRGIGGSRSVGFGPNRVLSLSDAVSKAIMGHLEGQSTDVAVEKSEGPRPTGNLCPECGSSGSYVYEEGCKKCYSCSYSEC